MTERIYIPVDDEIKSALLILAKRELRDPRYQATMLIRQKLIELGLLPAPDTSLSNQNLQGDSKHDKLA